MNETQASLRENLRALPRGAWILFFGTFLNKFGTFVLPFLAIYMTRLGYTSAQAGLAIGAYGIGTLGACLLGGYLADRLGRRKTIVLSMFSAALAMLSLSQARGLPLIVLFSGLAGLTGELYRPASSALLADLVPAGQRITAFAAYRMSLNAGFAFGPATAGLLAKHSFLWLFVGECRHLGALWARRVVRFACRPARHAGGQQPARDLERAAHRPTVPADTVRVPGRRSRLCAGLFDDEPGDHPERLFAFGLWPGDLIEWRAGRIVRAAIDHLHQAISGAVDDGARLPAIGVGFASNALTRTLPLLVLTVVLFTLGEMVAMPVSGAYVADLAPAHQRGLYMGTYGLVWSVAFICGPSLGMWLFSVSPLALWCGCGVLGLLAAGLILPEPRRLAISGC